MRRWRWLIAPVALYAVSFLLLVFFGSRRSVPGVAVAAGLLVVAAYVFNRGLRQHRDPARRLWRSLLLPSVAVVIGGALVGYWVSSGREGFGFAGLCLAFLGIGHLVSQVRWATPRLGWGLGLTAGCVVAGIVGLVVASGESPGWAIWLLPGGVLLAPIALSILSGGMLRRHAPKDPRGWRPLWLLIGAVVALAGGWLLVGDAGIEFKYALWLVLALLLLVGAIASNTPADVLVVVVVAALAWSIAPRGVPPTSSVIPANNATVLAALGDSFMSGEGAKQFYDGTNTKGVNECRRAPTAYAPLAVERGGQTMPSQLAFVACSGARAVQVYDQVQYRGDPVRTSADGQPAGGLNQLDHLAWLLREKDVTVKAVIVSVGGNDAMFGEVGRACVAPGDCTEIGARWLQNLDRVKSTIDTAYQRIRESPAIGNTVPVVVVPYPVPLRPAACPDSLLTANEHRFLYGFTRELNKVLRRAASDAGLYYLAEMETVLEQHSLRICDRSAGDVGVNFFGLNAVDGLVEQSVNPINWLHNSLHPNQRGHQKMSETLASWLAARPNLRPRPDPAPSAELGPPAIATVEQLMGDPNFRHCRRPNSGLAHCDDSADAWAVAQAGNVLRRSTPALLAVIAGAWIFWLALIWLWRRRIQPWLGAILGRRLRRLNRRADRAAERAARRTSPEPAGSTPSPPP